MRFVLPTLSFLSKLLKHSSTTDMKLFKVEKKFCSTFYILGKTFLHSILKGTTYQKAFYMAESLCKLTSGDSDRGRWWYRVGAFVTIRFVVVTTVILTTFRSCSWPRCRCVYSTGEDWTIVVTATLCNNFSHSLTVKKKIIINEYINRLFSRT